MAKPKVKLSFQQKFEIFRKVNDHIAEGDSIEKACNKENMPENFYFRFLSDNINNEEVCKLSTHAREMKAYGYFDKCEKALIDLETGVKEYTVAKVLFDSYLRLAAKANQKTFGDKQEIDHNVTVKTALVEFVDGQGESTDSEIIPTTSN